MKRFYGLTATFVNVYKQLKRFYGLATTFANALTGFKVTEFDSIPLAGISMPFEDVCKHL